MSNMLKTVEPKSSQLNADDLIAGQSKTIKITKVEIVNGDQPVAISYENDNGKPYLPCKSMRRVLIHCWGGDGAKYIGRSINLYCDPEVKFGGMAVGGIRISHMSHIDKEITVMLTATRANRKPFTVKPLVVQNQEAAPRLDDWLEDIANVPAVGLEHKFKEAYRLFPDAESRAKLTQAKDDRKLELGKV